MGWAQPRPRHAAPAGLAVAADGAKVYIALDDLDQVVEADTASQSITRRLPISGRPFGLALEGDRLFVTCRDSDEVGIIDRKEFKLLEKIPVGEAPVAIAFGRTSAGDRLVVANSV